MNTKMKKELLNDLLTGLAVAAAYATVMPTAALADIATSISTATTHVMAPAMGVLAMVSYGVGAVGVVSGIAAAKKHADAPSQNPLGPAIGRIAAGGAFIAAPYVVGMIASTGTESFAGSGTFSANGMGF